MVKDYLGNFRIIPVGGPTLPNVYFSETNDVYWARIILQEILQTFLFTLSYLVVAYEESMAKIDRVLKGFCLAFVLSACLFMTLNSGTIMNPAIAVAQATYMVILDNRNGSTLGSDEAQYMWVYIVFPFIGAVLAALMFHFHQVKEDTRDSVGQRGDSIASNSAQDIHARHLKSENMYLQ